ncbi:putative sterigmatocystin 8-O-methyltransferase precursor [Xylariaceae sp. FL0662B]|nr:putative sterigmatocystin 8-O-methyltransferase precursor [Xylariaceae sp. FL0662B]
MSLSLADAQALAEKIEAINRSEHFLSELKDDATRRRLREAGRRLSLAMEESGDTIHRIMKAPLQLALARVGVESHIFECISEVDGYPLPAEVVAERTKVDLVLMKRLLRYYEAYGMITQPGDNQYSSNHITSALASVGGISGINYFAETISPALMAFPKFLRENGYTEPTDSNHCPWHISHHRPNIPLFPWLKDQPEHMGYFLSWMAAQREGLPIFLDVIDFREELARGTLTESTPLFVDVGGAKGHQCIALRQRFPELPGRIILEDLPDVIEQVKSDPLPGFEDIEVQPHDFFTPQPVKGARAYYLRNILHDWPDHKCKEILNNLKIAMTRDSVVLIDEIVLPDRGAPWRAAQLDLVMSAVFAGKERSQSEWRALLQDVGLKISKIWKYTEECEDCVVVAVLE